MSATLQSILGDGVIPPDDLLPDDTTLLYDDNGTPVYEDYNDPDDELAADWRDYNRYIALAVSYYNDAHDTDYKVLKLKERVFSLEKHCSEKSTWIHCGFSAAPNTAVECESAAKYFCAKLQAEHEGEEVVTSCRILDGLKTTCNLCDISLWKDSSNCDTRRDKEVNRKKSEEYVPPLSQYSHYLADWVTWSDKAKYRVRFPLLAMAYYNKKKKADYKLVDALPYGVSFESHVPSVDFVVHCNFIARQQNAPADASNKLFAELEKSKRKDGWVVTACRVVRGKTTAGCHICPRRRGKRVIHPTRGFRFGLYPDRQLRGRC